MPQDAELVGLEGVADVGRQRRQMRERPHQFGRRGVTAGDRVGIVAAVILVVIAVVSGIRFAAALGRRATGGTDGLDRAGAGDLAFAVVVQFGVELRVGMVRVVEFGRHAQGLKP